jgi:aminoglycoside 3-N-acetyltransferase
MVVNKMMTVTQDDIRQAVRNLGLAGQPLCVHASLRSFGWVDGGADAVLEALLAERCTVMAPTFSWQPFFVAPPPHLRPQRNGWHYEGWDREHEGAVMPGSVRVFTPADNDIDQDAMGIVPATLLARPGRVRGNHPIGSFAAIGPLAHELIDRQTAVDIFAPFRALAALGGSVVLMGVGFDRLTLIHAAERQAGRNLFMRWANGADGHPIGVLGGGCSRGFPRLEPALAHLVSETRVGESLWKVLPAHETLDAAADLIREQPEITHCGRSDCDRCRDAILGGPILDGF